MSLSATLFGRDSAIFRAGNIMGLGIPGWLDRTFGAPDAQGPALGEMARQTSQEGTPRPIVWGIVRPIAGNMIAVQDPPEIRKVKQKQQGGKGGSKSKTTYVDAVFRTYAIRICEGPITGIRRVWRNNKLVYDNRGTPWGATNNGTFLAKAKFYLGGWDQMPAPELQAIFGMGNVTAHRGTAYMTMFDEDLTEMGGAVPQYIFEAERAEGYYLTSRPYQAQSLENLAVAPGVSSSELKTVIINLDAQDDYLVAEPSIDSISLFDSIPEVAEYLSAEPLVDYLTISTPLSAPKEHIAAEPSVTSWTFSITYLAVNPYHAVAVEPSITEAGIV